MVRKKCGGDINGRLRLTLEVIEEVRKKCGEDFIILLLVLGVVAFAIAMISYAIKQRRRRRMIDPIDHHHKRK